MSERCHNDPLDTANDVCDSCYGSYCSDCLVTLRTKPHPICKDCALILSGVRGTRKPKIAGDRKTVNQRRKELKEQPNDPNFFTFFDDKNNNVEMSEPETVDRSKDILPPSPLDKIQAITAPSPLERIQELAAVSDDENQDLESPRATNEPETQNELLPEPKQDKLDPAHPTHIEETVALDTSELRIYEPETTEPDKENNDLVVVTEQPQELDAIEEFDLGLETTSVRHKKNERMTFTTQVEAVPLPDPTHVTIEQLAAAKEKPVIAEPNLGIPRSPKEYIKLGTFDASVIDLANTSYIPKQKVELVKLAHPEELVEEKTPIRQQIDSMPQPPSHRRLHQKENTAEVPAVLNNVHPSELQREETFETSSMRTEPQKVEAFVGAPAEELDQRGVYVPPALRGKEYNDSPLPKRRREE